MAEKAYTLDTPVPGGVGNRAERTIFVQWSAVGNSDTFQALEIDGNVIDIVFDVYGTFDSATVAINGGNNSARMYALDDESGTAVGLTSAGLTSLNILPAIVQPAASGGGGSQSINVLAAIRLANSGR